MVLSALLQVRDLTVRLHSPAVTILNGITFDLARGESAGIVGESGCGKTTLAKTLIRLLSPRIWKASGAVRFRQIDILQAGERQLRQIRGAQIALISQEPELALNPVLTVGRQIDEVFRAHSKLDRRSRREQAKSMLAAAGLPEARIYSAYPHELSGGERQRVAIAQALIAKPALLIADEPTSALDNHTQAEILALLKRLKERFDLALLFITHNPALLNGLADRFLIMRAGSIVEQTNSERVYSNSSAPPQLAGARRTSTPHDLAPVLEVQHLTKTYTTGRGPFFKHFRALALEDVQLKIAPRSTLALVGKSGAGKSTLGRCVALLESPDSGVIRFMGEDLLALRGSELAAARRRIQLVFQHSVTAMNPRFSALEVVSEPLRIPGLADQRHCEERALDMLNEVGISPQWARRLPLEFSGGQRQRIALARALVLQPQLLVLDEALAGLDPGTQAQIVRLLLRLQDSLSLSCLFISHDLRMAAYLADEMAVIDDGRIVETGTVEDVWERPQHAATRELLDCLPEAPAPLPSQPDTVL